jgi:transposase InsO family protein
MVDGARLKRRDDPTGVTRQQSAGEAKLAIFRFIEGWYNPHRRHSACGNQSPMRYEITYDQLHQRAA